MAGEQQEQFVKHRSKGIEERESCLMGFNAAT